MNAEKPNPLVRVLPSLTDVAYLLPIAFLFLRMEGARSMLGDGDTGWHIRTGEWILAHGRVPDKDIFSFTKPGEPWFAWEWLWDVIFAWLHQHAGMAAVVLASMFVLALTSALLFRLVRRKCSNVVIAILVMLLATGGSAIHYLARPHLFTLLFTVIFYSILERVKDGHLRLLLWLPALTVLWTNLHGGFFVGIILLGAYAASELAGALVAPDAGSRRAVVLRSKPYLLTALGCGLASFINPYFYHLHQHIYAYLTDSYHYQNIVEFQSFSFHHPATVFFEPMLLVAAGAACWNLVQRRFVYAFLIAGWAHLALVTVRNVPIFMIVAAPPVALTLHELLLRLPGTQLAGWLKRAAAGVEQFAAEFGATDRVARLHLTSAAASLLLIALFYAPGAPAKCRSEYDPSKYPTKAVAVLRNPELSNTIFTDDEWGDYLIYRLYPSTKVFVDGRSDFYGSKFNGKYLDVMNVRHDWEKNLDRYHINTILLSPNTSLAGTLKESKRWRPIYDDGVAIVFRAIQSSAPESAQVSIVPGNDGKERDRKITKSQTSDPTITQPNLRSEPS